MSFSNVVSYLMAWAKLKHFSSCSPQLHIECPQSAAGPEFHHSHAPDKAPQCHATCQSRNLFLSQVHQSSAWILAAEHGHNQVNTPTVKSNQHSTQTLLFKWYRTNLYINRDLNLDSRQCYITAQLRVSTHCVFKGHQRGPSVNTTPNLLLTHGCSTDLQMSPTILINSHHIALTDIIYCKLYRKKTAHSLPDFVPVSVAQWANPHEPQCATRPDWLATVTGPGSTPGLGVSFSAKLD